jgi:hypothetical protein
MSQVVLVRLDWDRSAIPLRIRGFYTLHIEPDAAHPFGRKGAALAAAWSKLATEGTTGMVILDGDVAVDPYDLAAMYAAVNTDPAAVHVAPVRLWPVSTKMRAWIWGHGKTRFSQEDPPEVDMFGFSFTYLPALLVRSMIRHGLAGWEYPHVDEKARGRARALGLAVNVVRDATPKHLNY